MVIWLDVFLEFQPESGKSKLLNASASLSFKFNHLIQAVFVLCHSGC